jgi:hypothetical protein
MDSVENEKKKKKLGGTHRKPGDLLSVLTNIMGGTYKGIS